MPIDVVMPQLGESIAEGTIVRWLKKVGDTVQRDEPLLEISTDKVDAEIPSTAAGTLIAILANEGDTIAVNSVIAQLGEAGEKPELAEASPGITVTPPPAETAPPPAPPAAQAAPPPPAPTPTAPPAAAPTASGNVTNVVMPQLGESIAEGTIVRWLKKVGDTVQRDEPLLEISTDKVDAEIPSSAAGTLLSIVAQEGQTVAVNEIIATIGEAGAAAPAPAAPTPAPAAPAAPTPPPAAPPVAAAAAAGSVEELRRIKSSPVVRKIAAEHGVNIAQISGTGISGRVTKQDILNFIENKPAAPTVAPPTTPTVAPAAPQPVAPPPVAPPAAPAPPAPAKPAAPVFAAGERVKIEPMTKMRKSIADHMILSKRTSAHVTTFFEVDFTNVARLRERVKKDFEAKNGAKLTFMPFITKAAIDALKALPIVNASVDGDNIVYKQDINIGIAVALDWGLIVPVIKQADSMNLVGLARATQDLASRARNKQLKPDEVSGGTFSITNFGLFGGLTATPVINQPQVAILGVGGIHKRPWVMETEHGDVIAIRHIGILSLSFDHRIIDGAVGDEFLAKMKKTLETTDFSALL